jgi:hypothetical protein
MKHGLMNSAQSQKEVPWLENILLHTLQKIVDIDVQVHSEVKYEYHDLKLSSFTHHKKYSTLSHKNIVTFLLWLGKLPAV